MAPARIFTPTALSSTRHIESALCCALVRLSWCCRMQYTIFLHGEDRHTRVDGGWRPRKAHPIFRCYPIPDELLY